MSSDQVAPHWGVQQAGNTPFGNMPLQRTQQEVVGNAIPPQQPPFDPVPASPGFVVPQQPQFVPPPQVVGSALPADVPFAQTRAALAAASQPAQPQFPVQPVPTHVALQPLPSPVRSVQPAPVMQLAPVMQPIPVPPRVETPVLSQPERSSIQQLLRTFAKQPGCERYAGDANKVKLLQLYLFIRQLTPALTFETFLQLYMPLADYDDKNLKHPDDAVDYFLPRTAKKAAERNVPQWAAAGIVDYLALYVDMIREAEATNVPIPMDLNAFLGSEVLHVKFRNGDFDEVKPAKTQAAPAAAPAAGPIANGVVMPIVKTKKKKVVKPDETIVPVTGPGQRVIYTMDSGRQLRGHTTQYWVDTATQQAYVNFTADSGEMCNGIHISKIVSCIDPPANAPQTLAGDAIPIAETVSVQIPRVNHARALQALAMTVALGTVRVGDEIDVFTHQFADGHVAVLSITNGAQGPYVDARLLAGTDHSVVCEINPSRKNLDGTYTFTTDTAVYVLHVSGRE